MRHLTNQKKLTHCSSKFPGIPVGNFGGPRFPGIPGGLDTNTVLIVTLLGMLH